MADTLSSYGRKVELFQKELSADAQSHAIGKMAKEAAQEAAAGDLGSDGRFSGWRRGAPFELATKYDIIGPGRVSFHPTPKSAGPWTVAQSGRNQGNAGGFSGPGVNRSTGETSRTKSGGVRKVRARGARRWNGRTSGKNTASDALALIDKRLPRLVQENVGRALRKVF
jgi:hypothetical protein